MQRYGLCIAAISLLFAGCRPDAPDVISNSDAPVVTQADYSIGAPLMHENLTIFPILSKRVRDEDRFITLDEGLKAGTVKVYEVGAEGEVVEQPQADAAPNPPANANDDEPAVDDNDPRAAAPQPPAVDEETNADNDAEQPTPTIEPQLAEEQVDQATNEPQQVRIDDVAQQQGDFDLSFAQNGNPGGGREVNRLMVVNASDKPLYLMPGEVIIGGSQDRTIGQELVIAPGGEPVAVDVFCVEHERWHDRAVEETVMQLEVASQGALAGSIAVEGDSAANEAAAEIAKGKFVASVGNLNKSARLALQQSGDQGQVWDAVAMQNAASKVAGAGATFTYNYADADFVARLEPYIKAMHDPVAEHENVIGVIVAVNGKVESMDMFESTPLFNKLWPKLLKSYALDAATHAAGGEDEGEAKPAAVTIADAREFFSKATSGEVTKTESSGDLAVTARESKDVICFTSRQSVAAVEGLPADAAPAEAAGGTSGVHVSAFAH